MPVTITEPRPAVRTAQNASDVGAVRRVASVSEVPATRALDSHVKYAGWFRAWCQPAEKPPW